VGLASLCTDFHGVTLEVSADRADVLVAVRPGLSRLPGGSGATGVRIALRDCRQVPTPHTSSRLFRHGGVQGLQDGAALWLVADGCAVRIDEHATEASGWVTPAARGDGVSEVVHLALLELLRRRGLYHVHAACVVSEAGAVLLPADGRAGKTTLTLAALRAGWRLVGDDAVWLRDGPDGIQALAWPEPLHVERETAHRLGLTDSLGAPASAGRWELDPERAFPGSCVASARPIAVVFPVIAATETSGLTSLGRAEALARLLRQSPLLFTHLERAGGHLAVLRRLVTQCRCAELRSGAEVLSGVLPEALRAGLGLS